MDWVNVHSYLFTVSSRARVAINMTMLTLHTQLVALPVIIVGLIISNSGGGMVVFLTEG